MSRRGEASGGGREPQLGFLFEETVVEAAAPAKRRRDPLPSWARKALAAAPPVLTPAPEPPAAKAEPEPQAPARKVFRVAELLADLRARMDESYADLWVRGEISNLRAAPSGHLYFTLKDDSAALAAVMFSREARRLRFAPEDGHEVLLNGRFSLYEARGQIQLVAEYLEPVGAGSLQIAYEQLKRKLEADGLFAMDRKRPLPLYPRCVGIVTSPGGAVIRDFLTVVGRRHAALDVTLYPATVQGAAAAEEVAAGIAYFNASRCVDVVVIARGGGSLEDLQPFNSERLARAIAGSALPVVSAVGHETDFSIADFVADLRAPTPSAAAEIITDRQHRVGERVEELGARASRAAKLAVALARQRLQALSAEAGFGRVRSALQRREQRLDELGFRLEKAALRQLRAARDRQQAAHGALLRQDAAHRVRLMRERFAALEPRLAQAMARRLALARNGAERAEAAFRKLDPGATLAAARGQTGILAERLERAQAGKLGSARQSWDRSDRSLASLSPLAVLGRGYALVYREDKLLTRSADAEPGEPIRVRLAQGALAAVVSSKEDV